MTPEQMDDRAQREGRTFVSAGADGSRTYSRPHTDGVRISFLTQHPDGRAQYVKALPAGISQPPPSAPLTFLKVEHPSAPPSREQHSQLNTPRPLGPPMTTGEKAKSWFVVLFFYLPFSLAGLIGFSLGLRTTYTEWKTVSQGTYARFDAYPEKTVTHRGVTTNYGIIRLPSGKQTQVELDRIPPFATATPVTGWHMDDTFVRDKHLTRWMWNGGFFLILLSLSLLVFTTCLSSIRELIRG
jgi:hypothetical protein